MIKRYSELSKIQDFSERYEYLRLYGDVGRSTFAFDRYMNQKFYASREWKDVRRYVIVRDNGCDLGVPGFEIHDKILIHHMNPVTPEDIIHGSESILDPEYLISTTHQTHNAIHFGDESQLLVVPKERTRGDTKLW